jgi:hypothetical protein
MTSEYVVYLERIAVFTYNSFHKAFNGVKYISLNGRTIGEWRSGKRSSWNRKYYFRTCLVKLSKATKNVSQDIWSVCCVLLDFKFVYVYLTIAVLFCVLLSCVRKVVWWLIYAATDPRKCLFVYSSLHIVRMIKSRIGRAGHVACRNMG